MNKVLWVDTETTGLNPAKCTVHQVAGMIMVDGKLQEEFNLMFRPAEGAVVEKGALQVSGLTLEDVNSRDLSSFDAYTIFDNLLCTYVNKFSKEDKFVLAAYNANFDAGFLNAWYNTHGNKYFFGLCQGGAYLDPLQMALLLEIKEGEKIFRPDRKLVTVAKHYGVKLDNAHDALADIKATRGVCAKIWGDLFHE